VNGATFRYSHSTNTVTPVVRPFVTPAPGGGTFQGTVFSPSLNNRGDLFFDGIVPTDKGIPPPDEPYLGLGEGIFQADKAGHITSVVRPGDAAPGGGTFDWAGGPWANDGGDVAFEGHLAGELAINPPGFQPQAIEIGALNSVYVKNGATGKITSIAHVGDPAPGGGTFESAYSASINNAGDIVFLGIFSFDLGISGLFRSSKGVVSAIARPGDAMPGGGHLVTAGLLAGSQNHLNNQGDIVFTAALDTDVDGDLLPDTGLYQWSHGTLSLVARTGTVLPGIGTIETLTSPSVIVIPPPPTFSANGGAINNDRGEVLFSATLTDGRTVLLLETPTGPLLRVSLPNPGTTDPKDPSTLAALLSGERTVALTPLGEDLPTTPSAALLSVPTEPSSSAATHREAALGSTILAGPARSPAAQDQLLATDPDGLLSAARAEDVSLTWMC
jgi:hypothetical protein